ncbi:senescence-associated protein OSA15, chloroplastic-like isoform X1 [Zingiber officinale]|uniref:senescence-associated protein OSA15, chloroplastic-like isoform X1 n=1 Tax=Zingiber officinale TaxID=94328 RepID=UPI001C4BDBD0|nr:senescence-associated protein OSA15, chloroplastic-like isoform X1 [Zingiber officinale]XP_042429812.1 senescence-associated protein OSA15, chloroplastic-like isoform X1 [Zingiber officinale]XP_042429813.1 senescence-associated protein OSA15, chloroplastic-like isoform X1 [Zingiber officinale]
MAGKISCRMTVTDQSGFISFSDVSHYTGSTPLRKTIGFKKLCYGEFMSARSCSSYEDFGCMSPYAYIYPRGHMVIRCSANTSSSEAKKCIRNSEDPSRDHFEGGQDKGFTCHAGLGLAEACRFVYNDAKYVNERARNDIILLSRGITRLNDRARQDAAVLGLGFLKLDARAREDTGKIDIGVKEKAARLKHLATILKDRAKSDLKRAADQHWSDGALEADLRRADFIFRRRAMEDAYMALKVEDVLLFFQHRCGFIRNIHDMMANKLYQFPSNERSFSLKDRMGFITLEKNGKALDLFADEVTTDRMQAIQEAYWTMASALSEADGIDYTDPEELELLVATLIDLDAMDGKSSVSLLAECSSSPDVNTRKALANALATAPSMWILGNAGMGALQRLAQDINPAVAAAASKAINELRQQWKLEEGDSLRFVMNELSQEENGEDDDDVQEN